MDLDKLYESSETFGDRKELIKKIQNSGCGKFYNFDKYSDEQLYKMWERIKEEEELRVAADIDYYDRTHTAPVKVCPECGTPLNTSETCPCCDDGEEDY
jgi:rubrerythrin